MENLKQLGFFPRIKIKQRKILNQPKTGKLIDKNVYKGETPAVGSYSVSRSWIKNSFSVKQLPVSSQPTITHTKVIAKPPIKAILKPNHLTRPSKSEIRPRPHGIWEDFPLYSTPDSISSILSFQSERQQIANYQLKISESLKKLQNSLYF